MNWEILNRFVVKRSNIEFFHIFFVRKRIVIGNPLLIQKLEQSKAIYKIRLATTISTIQKIYFSDGKINLVF